MGFSKVLKNSRDEDSDPHRSLILRRFSLNQHFMGNYRCAVNSVNYCNKGLVMGNLVVLFSLFKYFSFLFKKKGVALGFSPMANRSGLIVCGPLVSDSILGPYCYWGVFPTSCAGIKEKKKQKGIFKIF